VDSSPAAHSREEPWPSAQPSWPDPPWLLQGRSVTAWWDAPWDLLERAISPSLHPPRAAKVRIRLRFYELTAEPLAQPQSEQLYLPVGTFHEAAVGLPTRSGEVSGETSAFLWADSTTYTMWAREAFGFPVIPGRIQLSGQLWTEQNSFERVTGGGSVEDEWGSASLDATIAGQVTEPGVSAGNWMSPRRLLHRAGLEPDTHEILLVRPTIRRPGNRYEGSGRVSFRFEPPHPLAGLAGAAADIDLVTGFELIVGDNVASI